MRGPQNTSILDDDAARQIASALQRNEIADTHVSLDIDIGADRTRFANHGIVSNEHEIADTRVLADLCVLGDYGVATVYGGHFDFGAGWAGGWHSGGVRSIGQQSDARVSRTVDQVDGSHAADPQPILRVEGLARDLAHVQSAFSALLRNPG
jgi:hypothetical protein